MRWSELKRSSRGAGGKPHGWVKCGKIKPRSEAQDAAFEEFADRLSKLRPGERAIMGRLPVTCEDIVMHAAELAVLDFENYGHRECESCGTSLAKEDPEDLIDGKTGLVCADCYQKPAYSRERYLDFRRSVAVTKFESLSTLRADVIVRFQTLTRTERVQ
jgi:hypothetical protein